ncbi:MAG: hypothetical protein JSV42_19400 [Chloroflexota bacterium]|nr:MAG: hypothetical protein JSV42_19400 [Chloroflexota bacterium]
MQLLPLWKAARSLSESDTVAEVELEALFNQIEDTMTADQILTIQEMQLSGEEIAQRMEELGINFGLQILDLETSLPKCRRLLRLFMKTEKDFQEVVIQVVDLVEKDLLEDHNLEVRVLAMEI